MHKALVDIISGEVEIKSYKKWSKLVYKNTGIQWGDRKGDVTGEVLHEFENELMNSRSHKRTYNFFWELTLTKSYIELTSETSVYLNITVCPSKIYHKGFNYGNIPLLEFNKILIQFAKDFNLNLKDIKPTAPTEPSITVSDPEYSFNQESLRGKIFSGKKDKHGDDRFIKTLNNEDDFMGYKLKLGHTTRKIYLPEIKFRKKLNSLRIEVRFDRVQHLIERKGITSWYDLMHPESHYKLFEILLDSWNDTIVIDTSLRRSSNYPEHINDMIYKGKKQNFWLNEFPRLATDKTLLNYHNAYREICFRKGEGLHTRVKHLIENEGAKLRDVTARLTCNNSEIEDKEPYIQDRNNNNKMKEVKVLEIKEAITIKPIMSNKQMQKYKQELRDTEYKKFQYALGQALHQLAA